MINSVIAGRYRLERRIGSGGMSEVWSATDRELERTVAVKLLAADADPARFDREARAAAGLAHANVCALYDYGLADGRRFMVLEYLPGGSLEDQLATGKPLADDETRRIAGEVAAGLAHAHERGVVHRDLKPSNILFDAEGRAKIADFGIARTAGAPGLTEAGTILGTAAYISPEQAAGRAATPASDVYAFGVILFRMLTGRLPFESPDGLALTAMHRDLPAPSVSELRSDAPALLESVAAAALAKSPADRPADGGALVAELAAGAPAPQGSTAATQVIPPPSSRNRQWLLVGGVALLAAAGAGLAIAMTIGGGTTSVPPPTTSQPTTPTAAQPAFTEQPTEATTAEPTTSPATTATTLPTTRETTTASTTSATAPTETTAPTTLPLTTVQPPPPPPTTATTTEPATSGATTSETAPATSTAPATDTTAATTAPPTVPG